MKLTRTFIGVSTATLAGIVFLVTVHRVALGKEPTPEIRVDSTPISREAASGNSYAPVVKRVAPSIVNIYSTRYIKERPQIDPFFSNPMFRQFFGNQFSQEEPVRTRREQSLGSGVIVSPNGYILTANHVVANADEIKVSIADSKKVYTARIIGRDPDTDVAVLKIEAANLPAVTLADSDQLEVGDVVLALGNPFGVGQTVTMGIVSALGRNELEGFQGYQDFIQTDAAINPGNSGGALVDAQGRLVGINDAIISPSGGNNGVGLAVPANMARNVMDRLIQGKKIARGYLGVFPQDINDTIARRFNLPNDNGALVDDVEPGSPADKAGLQSDDVIESVNDKTVTGGANLALMISELQPGTPATLQVIRSGQPKNIVVTLGELPDHIIAANDDENNSAAETVRADMMDGVTVADIEPGVRNQLDMPGSVKGALVSDVDAQSNAAEAGLRRGDIILEVNGKPVANANDAVRLCKDSKDPEILVKVWRRMHNNLAGTRYLTVDNTKHF